MDGAGLVVVGTASYSPSINFRASPSDPFSVALWWTPASTPIAIPMTKPSHNHGSAVGVSADGETVAGTSAHSTDGYSDDDQEAFVWRTNTLRGLGELAGDTMSRALALSADGSTVIGVSSTDFRSGGRLVAWTTSGGLAPLSDPLSSDMRFLWANVSRDGSVVAGTLFFEGTGRTESFRWTAAGGLQHLGTLPGRANSATFGLSADGSIIVGSSGSGNLVGADTLAFVWTEAAGMVQLPSTASGPTTPEAMNAEASVIVGQSGTVGNEVWWDRALVSHPLFGDATTFVARCHNRQTRVVSDDGKTFGGSCGPSSNPTMIGPLGFVARIP
jgi:uncharacterized membrane protein